MLMPRRKLRARAVPPRISGGGQAFCDQRGNRAATVFDRSAEISARDATQKAPELGEQRLVDTVAVTDGFDCFGRKRPILGEPDERVARCQAHQEEGEGRCEEEGDEGLADPAHDPPIHGRSRSICCPGLSAHCQTSDQLDSGRTTTLVKRRCTGVPNTGAARKMAGTSSAIWRTASR